ncbi:hypothetical protein J4447_01055 [Candidatus Pacearchaeota archaeon]|nr:hypothetical protein [Candidatus Pacearchaeota archaeon]
MKREVYLNFVACHNTITIHKLITLKNVILAEKLFKIKTYYASENILTGEFVLYYSS